MKYKTCLCSASNLAILSHSTDVLSLRVLDIPMMSTKKKTHGTSYNSSYQVPFYYSFQNVFVTVQGHFNFLYSFYLQLNFLTRVESI